MIDKIEQLINTLEQEINDGYNTLPDYQANNEGKTYVNVVVHNRKQIAQLIRDLRMHYGFPRIIRLSQPISISETTSKAS